MNTDPFDSSTRAATRADARPGTFAAIIRAVSLVSIVLAAPMAHGHSHSGEFEGVPIAELKRVYLSCDRAATGGQLNSAAIMQCSIVYEELKRRAFGGDFGKLLAWSRAQSSVQNAGR